MVKQWLISDTHFNHKMLIDNNFRPFITIEEMNEVIINNWNKLIHDDDIVYHLGDVVLNNKQHFDKCILPRLKGKVIFIRGNHDTINMSNIVSMVIQFKGKTFELIHNPAESKCNTDYVIHGHIHKSGKRNINVTDDMYNVNCEFHKYKPKLLNEILGELNERINTATDKN